MSHYVIIEVRCSQDLGEILMAELGELGYEAFQETESGITSSIETSRFNEDSLAKLFGKYESNVSWRTTKVDKENWNKKWEEFYEPVAINDKVFVRAPFHKANPSYKYEIIIMPKMSFGTGHHETTKLMLREILACELENASVLDAGCGTGILGLMAAKLGAVNVTAFDIEDWAFQNTIENFQLNKLKATIINGTVDDLPESNYDFIFANINKNVLLEQLEYYRDHLNPGGKLLISGFYRDDAADLVEAGKKYQLKKDAERTKNDWALLILSN